MRDPLTPHGGFADLTGYRLMAWRDGYAEVALTVEARHLNRSGVAHGGVLATLIDSACGHAGCFSDDPARPRRAFTLSLEQHFVAAAEEGDQLTATAVKSGGGRQIFFARAEVHDQNGRLVGQGSGVFRYRGGSGRPPAERA